MYGRKEKKFGNRVKQILNNPIFFYNTKILTNNPVVERSNGIERE